MTTSAPNLPHRSISIANILLDVARERGCTANALFNGTGIRASHLQDETAIISFDQEYRAIRNLIRHCGEASVLGLETGLRYHFTSISPVGFALVSSPTFRSAFDVTLRYADLNLSLAEVVLDSEDRDLRIGYLVDHIPLDLRRFALERVAGATLSIVRDLLMKPVLPRHVEFSFEPAGDAEPYRKLLGVMPRFGCSRNLLVLRQKDVDLPLHRQNPLAFRHAEEQCQRYLESWKRRTGLSARVREVIALHPRSMPPIAKVAVILCMSERTLRRRLQEEGTSYTALCDETKQAIAEQLLGIPRLPIEKIAERVGYSETASFIHAFKRWRNESPHAYRLRLRK